MRGPRSEGRWHGSRLGGAGPGSAPPALLLHPSSARRTVPTAAMCFGGLRSVCVLAGGLFAPPRGSACKEAAGEGSERASASVINRARARPLRALEECIAATPPSCQAGIIWIMLLSRAGVPHGDGEHGWASGNPSPGKLTGDGSGAGLRAGHGAAAVGCQEAVRCEGHGKGSGAGCGAWGPPSRAVLGTPGLARGSPGPSGAARCPGRAGGFGGAGGCPGEVDEVVSPVDPAGEDNLASNQFFKCAQLKDCL